MKIKWLAALLVICCLSFQASAYASADQHIQSVDFSQSSIAVASNANAFSVDILLDNNAPFSTAEFGLRLDGVKIQSVTLGSATAASSKVGPKESNGVTYFGFYDLANKYNGKINAATITFEYTGSAPATVTLAETKVTALTTDGYVSSETAQPNKALHVTRNEGGTSNPGGSTGTTPPPVNDSLFVLNSQDALVALDQAKPDKNNVKVVTLDASKVKPDDKGQMSVELPYFLLDASEKRTVAIVTPFGTFKLPSNVLTKEQAANANTLTLVVQKQDVSLLSNEVRTQVGNHPVFELHFLVNGQAIEWKNDAVSVAVSIPYAPTADEAKDGNKLVVYYIDGQDQLHAVANSTYNAQTGSIQFATSHFSRYGIAFARKSFTDIQTSWAKNEIEALAVRDIITGMTATTFAPAANMTRADFTKLLVGVLGVNAQNQGAGFSDVPSTAYYYEAVMTAKAVGLVSGSGDNKFNPKSQITRQEMIALMDRALTIAGKALSEKASLAAFSDAKQVAAYAADSAAKLVAAGIVSGSNGKLRPLDNLKRDEAAKVLYAIFTRLHA
ncbi:S-layer homology domain-containing protein [Paenibacillus sp. MWE-103]|uniref:S-layer homology domain-containing protein n=1 Tax=Paenibacillus artemisiicola TaxID=1172618 RepID=A0ABS3W9R9_9BACL|nr:S-layer homology domain-containing protein [Paenibacillus artemisiicola]MBO7745052.1 S-layer homology domain-containing protein [Paenibacillus artemisiicola]